MFFVELARKVLRVHLMLLEEPGPDSGNPLGNGLSVYVDSVTAVLRPGNCPEWLRQ
jgi:hypothetical protein